MHRRCYSFAPSIETGVQVFTVVNPEGTFPTSYQVGRYLIRFYVRYAGQPNKCYRCDSSVHHIKDCPHSPTFRHYYKCGREGHMYCTCPNNANIDSGITTNHHPVTTESSTPVNPHLSDNSQAEDDNTWTTDGWADDAIYSDITESARNTDNEQDVSTVDEGIQHQSGHDISTRKRGRSPTEQTNLCTAPESPKKQRQKKKKKKTATTTNEQHSESQQMTETTVIEQISESVVTGDTQSS